MKTSIITNLALVTTLLLTGGCSKNDDPVPAEEKTVYVAGYNRTDVGDYEIAIWKNSHKQILATNNSGVSSVYVSGNDVYAAGQLKSTVTNKFKAVLWKNGTQADLTDGSDEHASATSVFISGTDVYAAGYVQDATFAIHAVYWKNGVKTTLVPGPGRDDAQATSIFVSGTDIYVAASVRNSSGSYLVAVWKNGVYSELSTGSTDYTCTGLFVSGADVYVTGREYDITSPAPGRPRLWKNGATVTLNYPANTNASANCVFIAGNDVYVGGFVINPSTGEWNARYWKNSALVTVPDGPKSSCINSIYVDGTDVYAVGFEESETRVKAVKLWKNGAVSTLSDATAIQAEAYSVFVK